MKKQVCEKVDGLIKVRVDRDLEMLSMLESEIPTDKIRLKRLNFRD